MGRSLTSSRCCDTTIDTTSHEWLDPGPAHRIMSDLAAFIGQRDPATHRILAAGDLNLYYGATGGTLSLPTRARRRRRSRPVAACAAIAGRPVVCGQGAIRRAQTGGVRRPCGPSACGGEPVVADQKS